jgi:hypothetical protein
MFRAAVHPGQLNPDLELFIKWWPSARSGPLLFLGQCEFRQDEPDLQDMQVGVFSKINRMNKINSATFCHSVKMVPINSDTTMAACEFQKLPQNVMAGIWRAGLDSVHGPDVQP